MEIQINTICGVSLGFELFNDEYHGSGMMFDLFIFRVLVFFPFRLK